MKEGKNWSWGVLNSIKSGQRRWKERFGSQFQIDLESIVLNLDQNRMSANAIHVDIMETLGPGQ
jgi:hypothetical protein